MTHTYTFSAVTATDRAGLVWVAAILSLMFSVLTLAVRFQVKYHTLGWDDWCIAGATLLGLAQYITIYVGLSNGVGISTTLLEKHHAETLGDSVLASEILFCLAMALSKMSVVFFMKRLFTKQFKVAWLACNFALVITTIWGFGSALAVSIGCGPNHILYGSHRCVGKLTRWEIVLSTDAALEVFYVVLSVLLVYPLQMTKTIKLTVILAFAFRLLCAVFASFLGYFVAQYVKAPDPGLAIANVLVFQQVELGYALMAATIPTLKSFVRGYNKAMGWGSASKEKSGLGGGYNLGSYSLSGNRSHGASAMRSKHRSQMSPEDTGDLRPRDGDYSAGAYHSPGVAKGMRRTASSASGDSEDPIIRRDVLVTIEHERASSSA